MSGKHAMEAKNREDKTGFNCCKMRIRSHALGKIKVISIGGRHITDVTSTKLIPKVQKC